jgi:hypothetical protein
MLGEKEKDHVIVHWNGTSSKRKYLPSSTVVKLDYSLYKFMNSKETIDDFIISVNNKV